MTRNIVLVHGAFHTGACWYLLTPLLEAAGFTVHTPTLRGQRGNPRHPLLVSMQTAADDIIRCAQTLDSPCILLGHSLAGFAISAAAEQHPELFDMLIYLTAAVPNFGRSGLRDTLPPSRKTSVKMQLRVTLTLAPEAATATAYNCCTPHVQQHAISLLSPQPLRPLLGSITTTQARLGRIRKHLIAADTDNIMPLADLLSRQTALNFDSLRVMQSDHSPFLSQPAALAGIIAQLAATTNPAP